MAWDTTAFQVTTVAIATVESNLYYGAVNPSDPITLGIAQWYGVRAANILFRIKNETPSAFNDYCPDTIKTAMLSHPATDSWWNSRHVTREETVGFKNLLTRAAVKNIQVDQLTEDINGYLNTAAAWGLNKDAETAAVAFFCTVYHQSPKSASEICQNLPANSTLDHIYQAALNHPVVGDYATRQTTAYNIIKNGDVSGVTNPTDDAVIDDSGVPGGGDGGNDTSTGGGPYTGTNTGGNRRGTEASHIVEKGKTLILYNKNGSTSTFYKSGGVYLVADGSNGTRYTNFNPGPDDNPDNETNPNDGDTPIVPLIPGGSRATAEDIIAFCRTKLLDFDYGQGPGRMTPELSGYTDCSAFLVYAFQKGGNVSLGGTYTGNLCTRGRLVKEGAPTQAEMQTGDLIFLRWGGTVRSNSPFDHVEVYTGDGFMISMGRTPGPHQAAWNADINYAIGNGGRVQVRRYL